MQKRTSKSLVSIISDLIKESAAFPLSRMCSEERLERLKDAIYANRKKSWDWDHNIGRDQSEPREEYTISRESMKFPETCGQLAMFVRKAEDMEIGDDGIAGLEDYVMHITDEGILALEFLQDVYCAEYVRRTDPETYERDYKDYPDISDDFPILGIPLPYLYEAAARMWVGSDYIKHYEGVQGQYGYMQYLLYKQHPNAVERLDLPETLQFQPDKDTCFCDPVTMLKVVMDAYAADHKVFDEWEAWVNSDDYDERVYFGVNTDDVENNLFVEQQLIYSILILPFATE